MAWSDTARTRREVIRGALQGTAYAAPVVLSAAIPKAVAAASPVSADLALTKTVDNATPTVGTNVTFTLLVNNRGPAPATGVTVTDALPAGLTFVSASTAQGTYAAATGLWTIGTLATGARATLILVATAATVVAKVNTATVRAEQGDPDLTNNTASATVTPGAAPPAPSADLALTKTVDNATPTVGDTVAFTVTLTNNGPNAATGVQVTDTLPAGLTFLSATPSQGTYTAGTGVWSVGNLAVGGTATLLLRATVASAGTKTNTATITASSPADPVTTNNTATATLGATAADLALTKTVDNATPNGGDTVAFTVTLTNNGPSAATGVTVTDALPAGLTFVSSVPSQGTYTAATGVWAVGNVAVGATATLLLRATVAAVGTLTNSATITASSPADLVPGNNTASATVTAGPVPAADLALAKTVDNATPDLFGTVTFTVTLTNNGPSAATGVTVTDALPAGLTFVSSVPSQGTYTAATGVWAVGNVANGATATLAITATVGVAALPSATNTATITTSAPPDPNAANNSASASVTPRAADIAVTKALGNEAPVRGETLTFQVFAVNNGPNIATGVVVHDAIPANLGGGNVPVVDQGSYDAGTGDWTIGTLTVGQGVSLFLQGRYDGAITNTAARTASSPPDPDPTNDSATVNVPAPVP